MDKINMDFLNDSVFALLGRTDFVGGIDNEALDFGTLESFVHLPAINTSSNNGNTSAITLAITAVSTAPAHTITTSSAGVASANATTHGTLPESPPDSGSEPPYSPSDLVTNHLNQIGYHQHHFTSSQPANSHLEAMHVTDANIECHVNGTVNPPSSIHKMEDILLSSTAMPLSNSSMMLPGNDMMMHQNTQSLLGLGIHHPIGMGRNNVYRNDGNHLVTLSSEDDFSCLMSDPIFQKQPNGINGHQNVTNLQQQQNVNSYNPHVLSQMPTAVVPTSNSVEIPHLINNRKRTMSTMAQQNDYNTQSIIENSNDQQSVGNVIPIKRSTSVILPAIKPEPDALSPLCVSTLIEPATPPSKSSVDVCSNISSCSTSITPPSSTSIMIPSNLESNASPNQQGQMSSGSNMENGSNDSFPMQCIRFSPFQQQNWHILCHQSLQELPLPHYRVDADKGFNFSNSDDAFVCQKKNHFQITCHAQSQGAAAIFVRTESGLEKIKSFHLHFYGVKLETPTQVIRIEQSQSDRSKKPFHPVPIDLQNRQVSKITVGRLHFSETTSNNMRKKGRPNPEQRYFQLVVGLHAHTHSGNFPVISQGSERIIVRASNPGQFESDVELCWQRGVTQDSIFTHASRVGINTDRPDESLVVHGNLKVSGHIVHPSDSRAKHEIGELDTSLQLQNVQRIRVVKYRYDPEFAVHHGLTKQPALHSAKFNKNNECTNANDHPDVIDVIDTGVIAQEVREVLPDAVQEAGSVLLPSGEVIDNFLLVNKDRIYMENINAVKELCKVTGSLETRIEQLERMNSRLVHVRKVDQHKSDCSHSKCKFNKYDDDSTEPCSNKMIQISIVVLVIIMAICLAAISTLYFLEHSKPNDKHNIRSENEFENSSFVNNSFKFNTGSGDVIHSANNRHNSKKDSFKLNFNTQNVSNAQQQSLQPQSAASHSVPKSINGKLMDSQSKSNVPVQIIPEKVEKQNDYEKTMSQHASFNTTESTTKSQTKLPLGDHTNEVTTEKVQLKEERIVDNFPSISEPHEVSDSIIDSDSDVNTNIIDDGQQPLRNTSKSDEKTVAKSRSNDIENRNPHNLKDVFESDYHRERRIRTPIGQPTHCESSTSKNRTDLQLSCTSFCLHDASNANQVSDIPDSPEMAMPDVEFVETSTLFKLHKSTTKLLPIERKNDSLELSTTLSEHHNQSLEQTTAKDRVESSSMGPLTGAEQPFEVPELVILNTPSPIQSNNSAIDPMGVVGDTIKKLAKSKDSHEVSAELKQQEIVSEKLLENDIKQFNKIPDKFGMQLLDDAIEAPKSTGSIELLTPFTSPTQTASTPDYDMPIQPINPACLLIHLVIRSESFNISLGSDEICRNFNITYNIPLSKYMKESRFELAFVTQSQLQWTLCSVKDGNSPNITDDYPKGTQSHANFEVKVPAFGDFERQMEFQAIVQPSELTACPSPAQLKGPLQTVLYKINIYRDCTQ